MTERTDKVRLTDAQQDAVTRAKEHPLRRIHADPRTVRALLARGLASIQYIGEGADGPIYDACLVVPECAPQSGRTVDEA